MASSEEHLCDTCDLRHTKSYAVEWCSECEQKLCESCKTFHNVAKLSQRHTTVSLECFTKLPQFVKDMKNNCNEHNERFEYYCSSHECLCCVECVDTTHSECRSSTPMRKVIEQYKSSTKLIDTETLLADVMRNFKIIIDDRLRHVQSLAEQKTKCLEGIQEVKRSIIALFEQQEKKLINEIDCIYSQTNSRLQDLIKDLEKRKENIEQIQSQMNITKEYASDFQFFLTMHVLEASIKKEELLMRSKEFAESMKELHIEFCPVNILTLEKSFPELGIVKSTEIPFGQELVWEQHKKAQLLTTVKSRNVADIKLNVVFHDLGLPEGVKEFSILDNCILPSGQLIVTDKNNKRLIILDCSGKFEKEIVSSFTPRAIECIGEHMVAVSDFNNSNQLMKVNTTNDAVERYFKTEGGINFISRTNERILIRSENEYSITDLQGNKIANFSFKKAKILFSKLMHERVYCTQYSTNTVFCLDLEGNVIWEFTHDKLKAPAGITSDKSDILFVVGFKSNNICAISTDGKTFKELYTSDELSAVRAIDYNDAKKQLFVSTQTGKLSLFDVIF